MRKHIARWLRRGAQRLDPLPPPTVTLPPGEFTLSGPIRISGGVVLQGAPTTLRPETDTAIEFGSEGNGVRNFRVKPATPRAQKIQEIRKRLER